VVRPPDSIRVVIKASFEPTSLPKSIEGWSQKAGDVTAIVFNHDLWKVQYVSVNLVVVRKEWIT
jgi:hypothetical protein